MKGILQKNPKLGERDQVSISKVVSKIEVMNPFPGKKILSKNVRNELPQRWIERVDRKYVNFDTRLQKGSNVPGKERINPPWKLAGENSKPHKMFLGEAPGYFVNICGK